MHRVTVVAFLLLALSACKRQKSKPPEIDDVPAAEATSDTPPTAIEPGAMDLYGDSLPLHSSGRLGSLRMIDRSIRNMIFTANGSQAISTHRDGFQIWNLTDASRGAVLPQKDPGDLMAVSPSGKHLATTTAGMDQVVLWDLESGKSTAKVGTDGTLIGLCFLNDKELVTASATGELTTWNLERDGASKSFQGAWTDATVLACAPKAGWLGIGTNEGEAYLMKVGSDEAIKLGSADKRITSAAISSDGGTFAFGSADENILFWHAPAPGKPLRVQAHDRQVNNLAFHPDNSKLYSTGGDWWFRIWDAKSGEFAGEIPGIKGLDAQLMALSPDGHLIISWSQHGDERGSEAGRWWLWNASTGALLLEPERHRLALTAVDFSPDGTHIATSSEDRTVRLWDRKSTKSLKKLEGAQGKVNDVHFSSDGKSIWSAGVDARLRRWDWGQLDEFVPVESMGGAVNRFVIDGKTGRAIAGDQIGRVWSWELESGNKIQAYDRQGYSAIYDVDLSSDGRLLAIGGSARIVRIIDITAGKELAQLNPGNTKANHAVQFSADGKLLATAGDGHKIQLWNTSDWTRLVTLDGHDGTVRCLAFSPDGSRLVSGGNDELVKVWDLESGQELIAFEGHQGVVTDVAVSPDGTTAVSASRDRTALLWKMP